jgi:hypothetical protein
MRAASWHSGLVAMRIAAGNLLDLNAAVVAGVGRDQLVEHLRRMARTSRSRCRARRLASASDRGSFAGAASWQLAPRIGAQLEPRNPAPPPQMLREFRGRLPLRTTLLELRVQAPGSRTPRCAGSGRGSSAAGPARRPRGSAASCSAFHSRASAANNAASWASVTGSSAA